MRFRPEQHLRRQSDIRAVREQGRRVDCRAFTLWWKRRETPAIETTPAGLTGDLSAKASATAGASAKSDARVCVIASTAAVGHAVLRNRAKRRMREIFRQHPHRVPPGCDLLLIARAAVTERPLPELAQKFIDACGQIRPASSPEKND